MRIGEVGGGVIYSNSILIVNFVIRHWGVECERRFDKCVKLIERRGSDTLITRDCLSNLEAFRYLKRGIFRYLKGVFSGT